MKLLCRAVAPAVSSGIIALALCLPTAAVAGLGDCGQPVTSGSRPFASDALAILRVAVNLDQCDLCVCDIDSSGKVVATDALGTLRFAVRIAGAELNCIPCEVCGDSVVTGGEECDDGANNSDTVADACRSNCKLASCGDGVIDTPENCEPPDTAVCNPLCLACVGAAEVCNGVDDNCNDSVDEGLGTETCGVGVCETTVNVCVDGAPNACVPLPPQPEICDNGIDEDCDGSDCVTLSLDLDPPGREVTAEADLRVRGTVDARITEVSVNGVAAAVTAGSPSTFVADLTLDPGPNMVVAVGGDGLGNQGVDSFVITLDKVAPSIGINSPPDGFTTTAQEIVVTGVIADLVDGGVAPRVFVGDIEASVRHGTFMAPAVPLDLGRNTIEALALDGAGNQRTVSIDVTRRDMVGTRIVALSGDGQAAMVGEALLAPLVVEVKDEAGNPLAGRVVTFEVTRNNGELQAGVQSGLRRVQASTDGSGRASAVFTLGSRAGEGNNRVRVTAVGVLDQAVFCASALTRVPDKILELMGANQTGQVSEPLAEPFEVLVVDVDGNPIAQLPVSFRVLEGGGNFNGETDLQILSDDSGEARAVLVLGPATGINNNVVEVTFPGISTLAANFIASAVAAGPEAETTFSGVVLDNSNTPIPGARVTSQGVPASPGVAAPEIEAFTDDQGQFLLTDIAVGAVSIHVFTSTTSRPENFPPLSFEAVTIAGRDNSLPGGPIRIPELLNGGLMVGGDDEVVIEMAGVPGMSITVAPHSTTFPNGDATGLLSINQVHLDKVPMPPPSGTLFMPPAWTLQPAGVAFDPPARVSIPNDGLAPGRVIDIFQFDHDIGRFVNVGPGTVSEDGLVIVSDPGFGVVHTGWGGGSRPQPPTTCAAGCQDNNPCTTDSCENGQCVHKPGAEGAPCGTFAGCTERRCVVGVCSTVTKDCDDMDACTTDRCDKGVCFNDDIFEGGMCDNGKQCVDGICEGGLCVDSLTFPTGPCDDSDPCTQMDRCDLGMCVGTDLELMITAKVDGQMMSRRTRNCPFSFTSTVQTNCDKPLKINWAFGDGFTAMGAAAQHSYLNIGLFGASATAKCGECPTTASDGVQAKVSPQIEISNITPVVKTRLGKDTTIKYKITSFDNSSFDSVRLEIVNKSGETIFKLGGLASDPGTHTVIWPAAKWNTGAHVGAFANPNENPHSVRVIGKLANCEDTAKKDHKTHFRIDFRVEDKLAGPARSPGTIVAGVDLMGEALKVVLKLGMNETVFSGAQLMITGTKVEKLDVAVEDPGLDTLADGAYDVLIRDLRDDIGNFTDADNDPMNGIQEPKFGVELR